MEPDLAFNYDDADSYLSEIAEIFAYAELDDFERWAEVYADSMEKRSVSSRWMDLPDEEQVAFILELHDMLEANVDEKRVQAVSCCLYLLLGCHRDATSNAALVSCMRHNAFLLYEMGIWWALCASLAIDFEQQQVVANDSVEQRLQHVFRLRTCLAALCVMTETIRRKNYDIDCSLSVEGDEQLVPSARQLDRERVVRSNFATDIGIPAVSDQPIVQCLFQNLCRFCSGPAAAPHFPVRKALILLWKTLLVWLGGWEELRRLKDVARQRFGLPQCTEDTLLITKRMRAAPPPSMPIPGVGDQVDVDAPSALVRRGNRPLARRQLACLATSDDSESSDDSNNFGYNGELLSGQSDDLLVQKQNSSEDTSLNSSRKQSNELRLHEPNVLKRTLPWAPKIRPQDVDRFLQHERQKFFGFQCEYDTSTLIGFPQPIQECFKSLRKYVYASVGDIQIRNEESYQKYFFTQQEPAIEETPSEQLYKILLPQTAQYMIALLKVLLAAAPTAKPKASEALNILVEVWSIFGPNGPSNLPNSTLPTSASCPGLLSPDSVGVGANLEANGVEPQRLQILDVHRQKEIIVKSISAILLLLQKHLRVNHVLQFEHVSQQLVLANCIPLILKFFDQNVLAHVQSRHELPALNFPLCVLHRNATGQWPEADFNSFGLQAGDSLVASASSVFVSETAAANPPAAPAGYFVWRNLFSAVNLLRVLNKLTKWKECRTMMLVVFKSAPILKRALRVRHILLQLYALKLLKMQAKYLGRQWRKTNMEIISAIYSKVRHRLGDDWAYGNETNAKPWEYQSDECSMKQLCDRFNLRRYQEGASSISVDSLGGMLTSAVADPEFQPFDNNFLSVLGQTVTLTEQFKINYEKWLEREVFRSSIDWEQLLEMNRGSL